MERSCDIPLILLCHFGLCICGFFGVGVAVHEQCYGLHNENDDEKYPYWKCCACAAVGLEIKVSKPAEEYRSIKVKSRPTKCEFCSVSKGNHAMHMIYNNWGDNGTPLLCKVKGEDNVAWVHTLCALFVSQNLGLTYGCDKDGNYEMQDESDKSEFDYYRNDGSLGLTLFPHHFVLQINDEDDDDDDEWSRAVRVHQKENLKCFVCGLGSSSNPRKIAVQCHEKECCQAFHVGCVKWGNEGDIAFHIENEDNKEPEAIGYCELHKKKSHTTKSASKLKRRRSSTRSEIDDSSIISSSVLEPKKIQSIRRKSDQSLTPLSKPERSSSAQRIKQVSDPNSKYMIRKRDNELKYAKMVDDYKKSVQDAKERGRRLEDVVTRVKMHWKGEFTKGEFDKFWRQLRGEIADESFHVRSQQQRRSSDHSVTKVNGKNSRNNSMLSTSAAVSSDNSNLMDNRIDELGRNNNLVDTDDENLDTGRSGAATSDIWSHLWVPGYNVTNSFTFDTWDDVKVIDKKDMEHDVF